MPISEFGIGKGLREPCSPNRRAYFFGAELNAVSADSWNCIPEIVDRISSFDLSSISVNHEVVVALIGFEAVEGQDLRTTFRWYRDRDDALLFSSTYSKEKAWSWSYAYSYIGYLSSREIQENGDYHVEISVRGDLTYNRTISFTITGIPELEPEPVLPEAVGATIVTALNSASSFFYQIYLDVSGWVWPFSNIAPLFYVLSAAFNTLAWRFSDLITQINDIAAQVRQYLSWNTIWNLILQYVPNLTEIRDWFYSWTTYIWNEINEWWLPIKAVVRGWIDTATQGFNNLLTAWDTFRKVTFPQWTGRLDSLRGEWDNFWKVTYPALISRFDLEEWWNSRLLDLDSLKDGWFRDYEPFWAGWQDWKDKVIEFFTDPEEWLYRKLDSFIERFW